MKDFAGSSITYYGLARERVLNKYPRLISALMILALICMTGLAIFLISDLVSFASNPDHEGVFVGLNIKDPENGITSNSTPALENLSRQTNETNFANQSQVNSSLSSSQATKGVIVASKSSSSKSSSSKSSSSSDSVKNHHSSSSSSSSSTSPSSAKSAKKSNSSKNDTFTNALAINETAKSLTPTNQSMNNSQGKESENANAILTKDASARTPTVTIQFKTDISSRAKSEQNPNSETSLMEQSSILSDQESANSKPANDVSARVPTATIQFKTDTSSRAKSEQDLEKNPNSQAIGEQNSPSQKSKETISSQTQKAQNARAKQIANKNQVVENMKKKAAKSRAKTASN